MNLRRFDLTEFWNAVCDIIFLTRLLKCRQMFDIFGEEQENAQAVSKYNNLWIFPYDYSSHLLTTASDIAGREANDPKSWIPNLQNS